MFGRCVSLLLSSVLFPWYFHVKDSGALQQLTFSSVYMQYMHMHLLLILLYFLPVSISVSTFQPQLWMVRKYVCTDFSWELEKRIYVLCHWFHMNHSAREPDLSCNTSRNVPEQSSSSSHPSFIYTDLHHTFDPGASHLLWHSSPFRRLLFPRDFMCLVPSSLP